VERLLDAPEHSGRKAENLRFLGDLLRESGRCEQALSAYRRALGAGLSGQKSEMAREHLRRGCAELFPKKVGSTGEEEFGGR
jgi:hypothetical protein